MKQSSIIPCTRPLVGLNGACLNPSGQSGGGSGGYVATAKSYDGTNDYGSRASDLIGAVDGKAFTFAGHLKFSVDGTGVQVCNPGGGVRLWVGRTSANKLKVQARNTSGVSILDCLSVSTYTIATGWFWFGISSNLATPEVHMWTNTGSGDVNDADTPSSLIDGTIDMTEGGSLFATWTSPPSFLLPACVSEFWYDDQFIDFSVEENRRKFIDASGSPVDLGEDGSIPTGSVPLIYSKNGDVSANLGSGGNLTITGSLTDCADAP